jgi:hypothetical protein
VIGLWSAHSQTFLLVMATVTTLGFALPITFAPLLWSRVMQWKIPADTDLVIYFARCLGVFILIVEWLAFRAGFTGVAIGFTFQVLLAVFGLMVVLHAVGMVQRIQPWTENAEIVMYSALAALALLFWPAA